MIYSHCPKLLSMKVESKQNDLIEFKLKTNGVGEMVHKLRTLAFVK